METILGPIATEPVLQVILFGFTVVSLAAWFVIDLIKRKWRHCNGN